MMFFPGLLFGCAAAMFGIPIFFFILRLLGIYTTVRECQAKVYILFGKVIGVISDPGLACPLLRLGPGALLIPLFGAVRKVDLRLDQVYLRSRPVNSEEGTPMGIGVWYEMKISDPVDYLFKNIDPRGSLEANVTNATVRCLSNMPLDRLLEDRHGMSKMVRTEVTPKSDEWGYALGSVYIRKVHFRDQNMIRQIEQKVVNRLRQVTSAIKQAGKNQVEIIKSRAEKESASEFARAAAMRPQIVGTAIKEISKDNEIMQAVFDVLETRRILDSKAAVTIVPANDPGLLTALLSAEKKTPVWDDQDSDADKQPGHSSPPPRQPRGL